MRTQDLWFNWVDRSNVPYANQTQAGGTSGSPATSASNTNTSVGTGANINTYSGGRGNPDPVTTTVICNQCNGGYGIGNIFPGTVCPSGWTTDTDPCMTRGTTSGNGTSNSNGVTCYNCVNGVVEGRSYQNLSVCPQGETTDPNPCVTVLPVPQVICNSCQNGYPIGNIFYNECPQGWTTDKDPCKDTIIQGCMDPSAANYNQSAVVDDGMCVYVDPPIIDDVDIIVGEVDDTETISNVQFDNICYSCIDGSPKGTVIPSEVAGFCPEGYSQDMAGVCPKEETKDNNDLILYLAIGIGAYLLIK